MDYFLREYKRGDYHDAELLAEMWNASDKNFPGGRTRGMPETAERIMERMERVNCMAIFVVEYDGKIVGYGDLGAEPGQKDVAMLYMLNAHPEHHGKGVGKSLVLKVLERNIELGYKQLTLGTWAGNTKAVPLYKKTGFFWVPESNVFMRNFIPSIISLPITKGFFDRHSWYQCFKRDLSVKPDDMSWKGIKVFIYEFEADGEMVKVIVDIQSQSITAIETNDLAVACMVGAEDIPVGLEHPVKWEVKNKRPEKPLQVTLIATAEEGIALNTLEKFEVKDEINVEKTFSVATDIKPKQEEEPAHKIRSTLLIEGEPILLEAGVKTVQPIAIEYDGQRMIPNKDNERVQIRLRSYLDFPVNGTLFIDPHPDLELDKHSIDFSLDAKSWTSCTFWSKLNGNDVVQTKIYAKFSVEREGKEPVQVSTKPKAVSFRPILFGSIVKSYDEDGKVIRLESDILTANANLRGGDVDISGMDGGFCRIGNMTSELGPPFSQWRMIQPIYEYRLKEKDGHASITLIAPSDMFPDMVVERTVTISGSPSVKIDYRIINNSTSPQKFKLKVSSYRSLIGKIILPTKNGLLRQAVSGWGLFPEGSQDLSKLPKDYTERWSALEYNGHVVGMVWGECEENEFWGGPLQLLFDLPEIPPQSSIDLEPIYAIVGNGDWQKVRQYWQWLYQPSSVIEKRRPVAHPVLEVGFENQPLLITQESGFAKIVVNSNRGKKLNGQLTVECSDFSTKSYEVAGIDRDNPFTQDVNIEYSDLTPRVENACFSVKTELKVETFSSPVIILGNNGEVKYTEESGNITAIDNGFMSLKFAPDFFGSMVSLERNGVNHLLTSYPEAKPLLFLNPWYGGIHTIVGWAGEQAFLREKFTGEPVFRIGNRGLEWKGFKAICDREHKDSRWSRLETEYLTYPGSNVIAIVNRCINKTSAQMNEETGLCAWLQPGGSLDDLVLHYDYFKPLYEQAGSTNDQQRYSDNRFRNEYIARIECGHWTCIENPKTGDVIGLIGSAQDGNIFALDMGKQGILIQSNHWFGLEPNEVREGITWLVLCDSVEQARKYRAIGEIWELP
jgi:GNAT superfamily N-acetyltransferase